jgi:hypothetical protein
MWLILEFLQFLQKNSTTRLNVDIGLQTLIKILTPPLPMVALLVPPFPLVKILLKVIIIMLGVETDVGVTIPLMMET